jgi:dienelactone hydrolase
VRRTSIVISTLALLSIAATARAEIKTKEVDYKQDGTTLQGYFAWDDAAKGKKPGVLIIHEWWGHNEHSRKQAERYAKEGYVAFALDMYGKGKATTHPEDATKMMNEVMKDDKVLKARFDAALAELRKDPHVDAKKIAVIGYCMGGQIALTMARAGENIQAVSTFHAGIPPEAPVKKGAVKARILINNGADDPFVKPEALEGLRKSLADSGAKVEVINYPGAKHGFTNPEAGTHGMPQLAYSADADAKSFDNTIKLFKEVFGS